MLRAAGILTSGLVVGCATAASEPTGGGKDESPPPVRASATPTSTQPGTPPPTASHTEPAALSQADLALRNRIMAEQHLGQLAYGTTRLGEFLVLVQRDHDTPIAEASSVTAPVRELVAEQARFYATWFPGERWAQLESHAPMPIVVVREREVERWAEERIWNAYHSIRDPFGHGTRTATVHYVYTVGAMLIVLGNSWNGDPPPIFGHADIAAAWCLARTILGSIPVGQFSRGVPEWIENGLTTLVGLPMRGDPRVPADRPRGRWGQGWADVIRGWADPEWARELDAEWQMPRVRGTASEPLHITVREMVQCVDQQACYALLAPKAEPKGGGRFIAIPNYHQLVSAYGTAFIYFCHEWEAGRYWPGLVSYIGAERSAMLERGTGPPDGASALARFERALAPYTPDDLEAAFREFLRPKLR